MSWWYVNLRYLLNYGFASALSRTTHPTRLWCLPLHSYRYGIQVLKKRTSSWLELVNGQSHRQQLSLSAGKGVADYDGVGDCGSALRVETLVLLVNRTVIRFEPLRQFTQFITNFSLMIFILTEVQFLADRVFTN